MSHNFVYLVFYEDENDDEDQNFAMYTHPERAVFVFVIVFVPNGTAKLLKKNYFYPLPPPPFHFFSVFYVNI